MVDFVQLKKGTKNNMEWKEDIDFIIGYMNQCKKMDHSPEHLYDIIIFILKELKKLKE